jgi:hypothetical protein
MKFKGTNLSKRTMALLTAGMVMLGAGGVTLAVPNITSENYDAQLRQDALEVQLLENGTHVGSDDDANPGAIYGSIDKVEPGKAYDDVISVKNSGAADAYVRVIVRKYWADSESGKKALDLTPSMIKLDPESGWKEVTSADQPEYYIYYYQNVLKGTRDGNGGDEATLFKTLRIDPKVKTDGMEVSETKKGNKTIITYTYTYDGVSFGVEAEVQAVQTHNGKAAIKSVWGVDAASVGINAN